MQNNECVVRDDGVKVYTGLGVKTIKNALLGLRNTCTWECSIEDGFHTIKIFNQKHKLIKIIEEV